MANYHAEGYVARAFRWIRKWADEPASADAKYTDDELSQMLGISLREVLVDLYGNTLAPPYALHNITLVANQATYKLPANLGEMLRLGKMSSTLGTYEWEILPRGRMHPAGAGYLPIGNSDFKIIPTPNTGGDILTLEYIPNGTIVPHQNVTPLRGQLGTLLITTTSMYLNPKTNTNWFLGKYDRRPNGYTGCVVRILGTTHDVVPPLTSGSVPFFPIQERRITQYDLYSNAVAYVDPPFDAINWAALNDNDNLGQSGDPQTYLVYEVVPDTDPMVLWLAAIHTALSIMVAERKKEKAALLLDHYTRTKRAAALHWANIEQRRGHSMSKDPGTTTYWDAWEL